MANRGKAKAKNGYLKTKHDKMGYTQGYVFFVLVKTDKMA